MGDELEQKIEEWAKQYSPQGVIVYRTDFGVVVFRPVEPDDYDRFQDRMLSDKGSKAVALRELAQQSVIYPQLDAARQIFQRLPGITTAAGNKLYEQAGGLLEAEVKKA